MTPATPKGESRLQPCFMLLRKSQPIRYICQATAYQVLGDLESAKDAVARALGRQELENDLGLADRLIDLYTDGKGFPDEEEHFKSWMLEVHHNHKKSSERLRYIGGEWTRRCDAQLAKWKQ